MNLRKLIASILMLLSAAASAGPKPQAGAKESERRMLEALTGEFVLTSRFWPEAGFQGTGLMGYDSAEKRYWYVWTDTSSPGRSVLEGVLADDGTGRMEGHTPTPRGYAPLRIEIRRDAGSEIHEYHGPGPDGAHHRWLELRYQRRN